MSRKSVAQTPQLFRGRAIRYGLLTEAILIAIVVAGLSAGLSTGADTAIAVVGSFLLPLLFAIVLGRRLQARFVLHGILIGAAAFAIFMTLNVAGRMFQRDAPAQPPAYWMAHALKFVGGAPGGAIASKCSPPRSSIGFCTTVTR
jgi:putative membrane protein (TIGR04086 family)